MKNIAIARKLLLAFGALALIAFMAMGFVAHTQSAQSSAMADLDRYHRSIALFRQIEANSINRFSIAKGAIIAKDTGVYGKLYEDRTREAHDALAKLKEMLKGDVALDQSVTDLEGRIADTEREVFLDLLGKVKAGQAEDASEIIIKNTAWPRLEKMFNAMADTEKLLNAAIDSRKAAVDSASFNARTAMLAGALAMLFCTALLTRFLNADLARSVVQVTDVMRALDAGQLDAHIPSVDRGDEIGAMTKALSGFRDKLRDNERLRSAEAQRANDELGRAQTIKRAVASFSKDLGNLLDNLRAAEAELRQTGGALSADADLGRESVSDIAHAASQASGNASTVSAATEELSSSIREISSRMGEVAGTATGARTEAQGAKSIVAELTGAADQIGAVVSLISDIASQTNLLALNATIEAARAGDAGKGFAVVAGEVKTLANQTGKATDEISTLVSSVQKAVGEAAGAIDRVVTIITQLDSLSTSIASAVEEQSAATSEISRSVSQFSESVGQVSHRIQGLQTLVQNTSQSSKRLEDASEGMQRETERIKLTVGEFIEAVGGTDISRGFDR